MLLIFFLFIVFNFSFTEEIETCNKSSFLIDEIKCLYNSNRIEESRALLLILSKERALLESEQVLALNIFLKLDDRYILRNSIDVFVDSVATLEASYNFATNIYDYLLLPKKSLLVLEILYKKWPKIKYLKKTADIYWKLKKWDELESVLSTGITKFPNHYYFYYLNGILSLNKNKKKQWLRNVFGFKKDKQKYRTALNNFKKCQKLNIDYIPTILYSAKMYHYLRIIDSSFLFYEKARILNPNNLKLLKGLSGLYTDQGLYQKSIDCLEQAYLLDSLDLNIIRQLKLNFKRLNDFDKYELTHLERLSYALPDTLSIWQNLSVKYLEEKQYNKALSKLIYILDKDNSWIDIYNSIANVYLLMDSTEQAIPYFKRHIKNNPNDNIAIRNLSICLDKNGKFTEVTTLLKKNKNIKDPFLIYNLAVKYHNNSEFKLIVDIMDTNLVFSRPYSAAIIFGGALYKTGDFSLNTAKILSFAIGSKEENEMLNFMLADIYEKNEKIIDAIIFLKKCLEYCNNSCKNNEYYKFRLKKLQRSN